MERVQRTRSELKNTIQQTQLTIQKYKEVEKELESHFNQIVYIEPLPEPINKGVVVEPNLSKRIKQREMIAKIK